MMNSLRFPRMAAPRRWKFPTFYNSARSCLGVCFALAMLGASAVTAASIGVNFREGGADSRLGQMLGAGDVAGHPAVAQGNWNDVYITKEQGFTLVDDTGAATTATVRWGAANAWGDGSVPEPGNTPDETLARGNFDDGDGLSGDLAEGFVGAADDGIGVTVEISDVPYAEYSVVLYLSSDRGTGSVWGDYNVNGQTRSGGQNDGFANIGGWVAGRNAIAFTGLTDSTVDIQAPVRMDPIAGQIAGLQIVEGSVVIPEPAAAWLMTLGLLGGTMLVTRARRLR